MSAVGFSEKRVARDLANVDSELRLIAAVGQACEDLGTLPSTDPADRLLDERLALQSSKQVVAGCLRKWPQSPDLYVSGGTRRITFALLIKCVDAPKNAWTASRGRSEGNLLSPFVYRAERGEGECRG